MHGLASYLKSHVGEDPARYEYCQKTQRIFLYNVLEEALWEKLHRELEVAHHRRSDIQKCVDEILEAHPDLGWVSVEDAVSKYRFMPCGFVAAEVYGLNQKLLGHTVVTCGGGLAYPAIFSTDEEWQKLIMFLLGCSECKPVIDVDLGVDNGYIVVPGRNPVRWVEINRGNLKPVAGVVSFRKPADFKDLPASSYPNWANEYFLELEPLQAWDEGAPDILSALIQSASPFVPDNQAKLAETQLAYMMSESPEKICRQWLEITKLAAAYQPPAPLATLLAKVSGLPTLPSSGSTLEDLFAYLEIRGVDGFEKELHATVTSEGRRRVSEREEQMADTRIRLYPHLELFSTQALTYWWRQYIKETESASADVARDSAFMVSERGFDEDFIYYLALKSTENYGSLDYVFGHNDSLLVRCALKYLGLEEATKRRVRGAVMLQWHLLEHIGSEEIPDLVNEWRHHINRVVEMAVSSAAVSEFCLAYTRKGPRLFSPEDKIYCAERKIIMSYQLPKV